MTDRRSVVLNGTSELFDFDVSTMPTHMVDKAYARVDQLFPELRDTERWAERAFEATKLMYEWKNGLTLDAPAPERVAASTPLSVLEPIPSLVEEEVQFHAKPITEVASPPETATPGVSSLAPSALIRVRIDKADGDTIEAFYHDVVLQGHFLTLVYDHQTPAQSIYRPGGSSEQELHLAISSPHAGQPPTVYQCLRTGYQLRYRNLEFLPLIVADTRPYLPENLE